MSCVPKTYTAGKWMTNSDFVRGIQAAPANFLVMNHKSEHEPPSFRYLELVTQSQRTLYGVLWSLLRNSNDVDDVLQETNAVLWQKAAEFDASRDFLPWALKIAQLQVLAFRKRQQRDKLVFDDGLSIALLEHSVRNVEQNEPRRRALVGCLQKLPFDHRELVLRRYGSSSSVNDMAAESGRSPKAISEALRRIRCILLDCIERTLAQEAGA